MGNGEGRRHDVPLQPAVSLSTSRALFTAIRAPRERWEKILLDVVNPFVTEIREQPELASFDFGRYNKPTWQIGLRVAGPSPWIEDFVYPLLHERLLRARGEGLVNGHEYGEDPPELERYGGAEGVRLTEVIHHHDALACLDLMEAESHGKLERTRREYSLVMIERLLDLMNLEDERRTAFYERGFRWAITIGTWKTEDLSTLDRRFEALKPGLTSLIRGEESRSPEVQWGGATPAGIARACLDATAPVAAEALEAHASGRITQDPVNLAWAWTEMHSNRLGIVNVAQAVLRYFMYRLHGGPGIDAA
jgi:thiopeptide-type bacteriocin biosynthesis protein